MTFRTCWQCHKAANMTPLTDRALSYYDSSSEQTNAWMAQAVYSCDACRAVSLRLAPLFAFDEEGGPGHLEEEDALSDESIAWWLPQEVSGRAFPDVPEHIASAATEAYECLAISAYRGAGALARAVVEATAKEKGITRGRLIDKIEEMEKEGLIRAHIKDAAHEVRHLGNDVAHGDFIDVTTKEETEETLELMGEILNEVYQSPAKIAKRQAARLAKKGA